MMLIYVTVCDSEGRDASVLLDISRLIAVAPFTEQSPRYMPSLAGLAGCCRPRNRNYLTIYVGTHSWVVPASEWPRIKAALVRVNGGGFNRFGNNTEHLECPQYLRTPAVGEAAAREETMDTALLHADAELAAIGRETFPADAIRIAGGVDMGLTDTGAGTVSCSP